MTPKNPKMDIEAGLNTAKMEAGTQRAKTALRSLSAEVRRATDGMNRSFGNLNRAASLLQGGFVAFGAISITTSLLRVADNMTMLEGRIKLATKSTGDFKGMLEGLKSITSGTGGDLSSTVELFQRLVPAAKDLGKSNNDVLKVVDSVQKLGVVSGASAVAMKAGTLQFGQAMSGGILRAEEFNSIMENIPAVGQEIAAGFGTTTGQLRNAVLEGRVLAKDVFEIMVERSGEINKNFREMPMTMERASSRLKMSFDSMVSSFDKALHITQTMAGVMNNIAQTIDTGVEGARYSSTLRDLRQDPDYIKRERAYVQQFTLWRDREQASMFFLDREINKRLHPTAKDTPQPTKPTIHKLGAPSGRGGVGAKGPDLFDASMLPFQKLYFSTKDRFTAAQLRYLADVDKALADAGVKFKAQVSAGFTMQGHSNGKGGEHAGGNAFDFGLSNLRGRGQQKQLFDILSGIAGTQDVGTSVFSGGKARQLGGHSDHFHVRMLQPEMQSIAAELIRPVEEVKEKWYALMGESTSLGADIQGAMLKGLADANGGVDTMLDYRIKQFEKFRQVTEELKSPLQKAVEQFEDYNNLIAEHAGEMDRANLQMGNFRQLVDSIGQDGMTQLIEQFREFGTLSEEELQPMLDTLDALGGKIKDQASEQEGMMSSLEAAVRGVGSSMEETFMQFAKTGKLAIGDFVGSALQDISKLIFQMMVIRPLFGGFGLDFGKSLIGGALTKVFHLPTPVAGARADGGPVGAGSTYLVGERGPELFTPSRSGSITPNHALGAGAPHVTVNLHLTAGVPEQVKQVLVSMMPTIRQQTLHSVLEAYQRGGRAYQVLGAR